MCYDNEICRPQSTTPRRDHMGDQACKAVNASAVPGFMRGTVSEWLCSPASQKICAPASQKVTVADNEYDASKVFVSAGPVSPWEVRNLDKNNDSFISVDETESREKFQDLVNGKFCNKTCRVVIAMDVSDASDELTKTFIGYSYTPFSPPDVLFSLRYSQLAKSCR